MSLFELKQEDINSLRSLICAESLTITANIAKRVVYLQVMLEQMQPSTALDESKARCEVLEKQNAECLRVRDAALLEAGLAKRRIDELEAAARPQVEHDGVCPCVHAATIRELELELASRSTPT